MNTPTHRLPARHRYLDGEPLRFRAELPAVIARPRLPQAAFAQHDFLVPNPRPDLTREITPAVLER